ncbi:MAG: hypothetical protein V9E84_02230 [Trichococcus flocculiformis]
MANAKDCTDQAPSAYDAFWKLVGTNELRQQIQGMIDLGSKQYDPWRAMRLMNKAIEERWWSDQEGLQKLGLPYRTDIPDWIYPAPLIDNGNKGLQSQYANAFRHTFDYLELGLFPNRRTPLQGFRHYKP